LFIGLKQLIFVLIYTEQIVKILVNTELLHWACRSNVLYRSELRPWDFGRLASSGFDGETWV